MPDARDVLALVGVALIAVGAWFIYKPAAPIVVGIFCLGIGTWRRRGVD